MWFCDRWIPYSWLMLLLWLFHIFGFPRNDDCLKEPVYSTASVVEKGWQLSLSDKKRSHGSNSMRLAMVICCCTLYSVQCDSNGHRHTSEAMREARMFVMNDEWPIAQNANNRDTNNTHGDGECRMGDTWDILFFLQCAIIIYLRNNDIGIRLLRCNNDITEGDTCSFCFVCRVCEYRMEFHRAIMPAATAFTNNTALHIQPQTFISDQWICLLYTHTVYLERSVVAVCSFE